MLRVQLLTQVKHHLRILVLVQHGVGLDTVDQAGRVVRGAGVGAFKDLDGFAGFEALDKGNAQPQEDFGLFATHGECTPEGFHSVTVAFERFEGQSEAVEPVFLIRDDCEGAIERIQRAVPLARFVEVLGLLRVLLSVLPFAHGAAGTNFGWWGQCR